MDREAIQQGIQDMLSLKEITKNKLKKAGLFIPARPSAVVNGVDLYSEWEALKRRYGGIANIPHEELGEYLDRWTAMISYTRWVEAVADLEQATAREIRDTIRKQLYTLQEGGREIRDAMVYTEPLYQEWERKYTEALALYIQVKALREGYEQRATAISREITRRGTDMLDVRRSINRGQVS